ncbi:AAA family protein [Phlyctema vagabunda]|uniref:AAA family protein n=1 Tax=Phlyctema vagabunda TaxID=108571 RepID=A0ABR4PWP6_9HELO
MKILAEAKAQQEKKRPSKAPGEERTLKERIKDRFADATETAYEYTQILDVMVGQAPEFVGLAYGAVKILLVVQINYTELKVKVRDHMETIKEKFDIIDHLTAYIPTRRLAKAVSNAYSEFSRFLAKAVKYYTENKFKSYLKSFAKRWKKFDNIVGSIEQAFVTIREIAQYQGLITTHANLILSRENLAASNRIIKSQEKISVIVEEIKEKVNAITVTFAKRSDVQETAALLHQRVEEELDQIAFADETLGNGLATESPRGHFSEIGGPDELLGEIFTELRDFTEASSKHMEAIKELPEMKAHRSKQKNMLRTEKVMAWIEADTSQILNIDGCGFLRRVDFNTLFTIPILVLSGNNHESVLVLRHFCGDPQSLRTNSYRTLVQALLFQLLQQNPSLYKKNRASFSRGQASDMKQLWELLISFIKEVKATCTFIIIDGIDALESEHSSGLSQEKDIIQQQLLSLVKDEFILVKILLTTSLAVKSWMITDGNLALAEFRGHRHRQPQRTLSISAIDNEMALIPSKLVEIQEKRLRKSHFAEIALLYPPQSTFYSYDRNSLRAFVVMERSGMEPIYPNYWSPLMLRARSVRHNGKRFVRQIHEFEIPQFTGEREISSLKFIPSGYLPDESSHRAVLLARGRAYVELAEGVHYRQIERDGAISRVIVDQGSSVRPPHGFSELLEEETEYNPSNTLRPLTLMLCPSHIPAFFYDNLSESSDVEIDRLEPIVFHPETFDELVLPEKNKEMLVAIVSEQRKGNVKSDEGLVVLLHGAPGTGKTATAKATAELMRVPLRVFSLGDLGNGTSEIASKLYSFFEASRRWNAIVLINDADAILEERSRSEMERNKAVAIIIGFLEHFTGTLFLTTNRVGVLDEAVKSRTRLTLHFEVLGYNARRDVWGNLVRSLCTADEYTELADHWDIVAKRMDDRHLNGGQIKNILITAKQLANHRQKQLGWEEVELAVGTVIEFDEYLRDVFGGITDQERSKDREIR